MSVAHRSHVRRMTDVEALLWSLDADPALRSAFISVTFLDRPPDFERFRRRVAEAVATTRGLAERVIPPAVEFLTPRWETDSAFDLDFHVRRLALPAPAGVREVLDLAALLCQDPFERTRPLWQFTVVEGLSGGGAALLAKMHHVLSDGVGAIRMSSAFLDLSPDGEALRPPRPASPEAQREGRGILDAAGGAGSVLAGNLHTAGRVAGGVAGGVIGAVRRPQHLTGETVALARSLGRQLAVVQAARSPLWTGQQSFVHRFEVLSIDLDEVKAAAKRLGGTVNDVFVAAVAGAAGAYHRQRGVEVGDLRMSMPVSTRSDKAVGGNAWAPTRLLVPAGEPDPAARFAAVHDRLEMTKRERSIGLTGAFTSLLRGLPSPLVVRLARQQAGTVDFACSNVRGAPFDLWISGARVVGNHPMGPTAGTAFNATVLSYKDRLDLGLNADTGAIDNPAELRDHIEAAFAELFAASG